MYKINFNHLYNFLVIAREGSIVKASKKLHITQPAMSHQLKTLEQDLGKKLFDRIGKRLVLNKDGIAVRDYATKIFRNSEEMLHVLNNESNKSQRIIRIGTVSWLSKDQTFDFIKPLISSPHVKIEVFQKDLDSLIKDLSDKKIDLILCDSPYSGRSKKLHGHRLSLDPILCVAKNKSSIRGNFPACIQGKKAVTYSEACIMGDKIDDYLQSNEINLDIVGSFSDSSLMRVTIERTNLIGFLPKSVVKQSLREKTLIKLGELDSIKFSLWALTRKDYKNDGLLFKVIQRTKSSK